MNVFLEQWIDNFNRIPESSPCLHDKVLAAAVEAARSASSNQKR
jgi:hypothetical protein